MPQMPGKKLEDRCSAMFRNILVFYRTAPAGNRLDTLTLGIEEIAEKMLDATDPLESTILNAAKCLNHCYSFLSRENFDQDQLAQQCRQFCICMLPLLSISAMLGKIFGYSSQSSTCFRSCVSSKVATPACIGPIEMKTLGAQWPTQPEEEVVQTQSFPLPRMCWRNSLLKLLSLNGLCSRKKSAALCYTCDLHCTSPVARTSSSSSRTGLGISFRGDAESRY